MKKRFKTCCAWVLVLCCLLGASPLAAAEAPAENTQVRYSTEEPLILNILWQASVDGQPMDINVYLSGTTDDGEEIIHNPDGNEYTSPSGQVASYTDHGNWIELIINRHDAVMDVVVEYGDVMPFGAPSYLDANLEIQIYDAQYNIIADIAANSDACAYTDSPYVIDASPFYSRGATGVWYYSFRLDHGAVEKAFDEPGLKFF